MLKQSRDDKARALDKPEIKTMLLLTLATRKIRTSLSTLITPSSECVCSTSSAQKGRIATRSTKFMNSSTWEEKRLSPARRSGIHVAARGQAGVESRPDSERAIRETQQSRVFEEVHAEEMIDHRGLARGTRGGGQGGMRTVGPVGAADELERVLRKQARAVYDAERGNFLSTSNFEQLVVRHSRFKSHK